MGEHFVKKGVKSNILVKGIIQKWMPILVLITFIELVFIQVALCWYPTDIYSRLTFMRNVNFNLDLNVNRNIIQRECLD